MEIKALVEKLSSDPFNPENNFNVAIEYERLGQTASAVSFYLRAAEYGYNSSPEIVYTSLLKMAKCFEDQNDRKMTVSNCILQAAAYLPNRPEAYFLLAQFYERSNEWQECYTWASMGLLYTDDHTHLPAPVGYLGSYCLDFEKAVSGWWIGRKKESLGIFKGLLEKNIDTVYREAINNNLGKLDDSI